MKSRKCPSLFKHYLLLFFCLSGFNWALVQAQSIEPNTYYRLTTQWQGDGKSLDVINDGTNNRIHLAQTGDYSGQYWKFTPSGNDYYRVTTQWLGDGKSLDVVNDGRNNQLQLADSGNYSGQFWRVIPIGNGYFRLTTQWQGDGKSLDVVNDGRNNRLQLADTGNFSGQFWKLTPYQLAQPIAQAPAQSPEQICHDMVQGNVAWSQNGDRHWQENNVRNLCAGTNDPDQTVSCFQQGIATHDNWSKAINDCAGNRPIASNQPPAWTPIPQPVPPVMEQSNEQICHDMVQGKVAWSQNGDRRWQENNVRSLCAGTGNPHQTVSCFQQGIATHNNWGRAISDCAGNRPVAVNQPPAWTPGPEAVPVPPMMGQNKEQMCHDMVQGRVAWSRNGDRRWQENNVRKLCAGTNNPRQTVNCFRQGIASHNDWSRAIAECASMGKASKRAVEAGPIWNQADANKKCPRIAAQNNGTWTGQWWTTVQGRMSVCEIQ